MASIQDGKLHADRSPAKWLQLKNDVGGIAAEVVNELEGKLNEFKNQLESETEGTVGKSRFEVKRI